MLVVSWGGAGVQGQRCGAQGGGQEPGRAEGFGHGSKQLRLMIITNTQDTYGGVNNQHSGSPAFLTSTCGRFLKSVSFKERFPP